MEPIIFGLDLAALLSIPIMIALFAFAIWYGATRFSVGIDAEEQARRQAVPSRHATPSSVGADNAEQARRPAVPLRPAKP
jgi:hypothetical protein